MYKPTPQTITSYTEGDCWNLALTIRKMTGFPLVVSFSHADGDYPWQHFGVYIPNKERVLDIEGLCELDVWHENWCSHPETLDHSIFDDDNIIKEMLRHTTRFFRIKTSRVAQRLIETYL